MIFRVEMILPVVFYRRKNVQLTKNNTLIMFFLWQNFSLLSPLTNFLEIIGFSQIIAYFSDTIFSTALLFQIMKIIEKIFKYSYLNKKIILMISATQNWIIPFRIDRAIRVDVTVSRQSRKISSTLKCKRHVFFLFA